MMGYDRDDVELGKMGKLQGTTLNPQPLDSFMKFSGDEGIEKSPGDFSPLPDAGM